ncbi:hypothetical protein, partial [Candidatus Frankia alpina]|uniref:hypothetical protein n=1 Tax=Candidatus Frankia alpina TaxID=2699483 RepID=UPI001A98CE02
SIPPGKIWYNRKGKTSSKKPGAATIPRAKSSVGASGSKKSVKPKAAASQPKKGGKSATISRPVVLPRGGLASVVSTDVAGPEAELPEIPGPKASTAQATASSLVLVEAENDTEGASGEAIPGPSVVDIAEGPEEPAKDTPSARSAIKRKGKEVASGSPKRARFAPDPLEYALTRATEAELLFGRPRFILPTSSVVREDPVDETEASVRSLAEEIEAVPASEGHLLIGNDSSLGPQDGSGSGDQVVMAPEGLLGTGVVDSSVPAEGGSDRVEIVESPELEACVDQPEIGSDRVEIVESPEPETYEDQPEIRNSSPGLAEAGTSQQGASVASLMEGLSTGPLEALMGLLPEGSSLASGTGASAGELAEAILQAQLEV